MKMSEPIVKILIPPGKQIFIRKSLDHPWSEYVSTSWTEGELVQKAVTKTHKVVKRNGWYAMVRNEDIRIVGGAKRKKPPKISRKPKSTPVGAARMPEVKVGMRDYTPPIVWRRNDK